jgi:hypothetical protein
MPIPSLYLQKKKKARMPVFSTTFIPAEFEQGLAMMAGAAAAFGAANTQIADESSSAFIAIDRRRGGGLARPVSAKVAMRDYGPELQAAIGRGIDDVSLGKGHLFKAAPAYDAATGTVFVNADLTLLHTKTWRALHNPSLARLRLL